MVWAWDQLYFPGKHIKVFIGTHVTQLLRLVFYLGHLHTPSPCLNMSSTNRQTSRPKRMPRRVLTFLYAMPFLPILAIKAGDFCGFFCGISIKVSKLRQPGSRCHCHCHFPRFVAFLLRPTVFNFISFSDSAIFYFQQTIARLQFTVLSWIFPFTNKVEQGARIKFKKIIRKKKNKKLVETLNETCTVCLTL